MNKKRIHECIVLNCLTRPGVIGRFFRRYYLSRLSRQIERLPQMAKKLGRSYATSHKSFFIL